MRSALLLLSGLLLAGAAVAQPAIRVEAGDWGGAPVRDVEAVLVSVARVMMADFPQHAAVRVVVRPSPAGPRVLAERAADGAHQVLLNVRGPRWDQLAYQFSHELCHIVSNYDLRPVDATRKHQWFEEAVCEAVSIVALQRLAARWQDEPPHASWAAYAPAFHHYAQRLLNAAHRQLDPSTTFAAWYRRNAPAMAADPYLREKNELVATALVELFAREGLQSVGYLNRHAAPGSGFAAYLAAWHDCCPETHRPVVRRLLALFST